MALHVWIVGVDDYGEYDRSVGLPPGRSDLRGAVDDALTLDRHLRRLDGIEEVRTEVRIAPRGWLRCDVTATRARILSSLDRVLRNARADGTAPTLAFFGRGAVTTSGECALCPSDVGAGLARAIPLSTIRRKLDRYFPGERVHVWLGATFGADEYGGVGLRTLTPDRPYTRPELRACDSVAHHMYEQDAPVDPQMLRSRGSLLWEHAQEWRGGGEIGAEHTGFRVCDVVGEHGILGWLVVTDATFQPVGGYQPSQDTWWWNPSATQPWPNRFRLAIRAGAPLPTRPPPEALEVYPGMPFPTAPLGALTANGTGCVYELLRQSPGQSPQPLQAHLWCHGEAPSREQEWFTTQTDAEGYLPFGPGTELIFQRVSTASTPPDRRVIRVRQIAPA